MYFMFRLISNDYRYIFYGIYLGIFLLLPLSVFQIFEFALSSKRLSGFSSELSHFGHFLVFALIPAIMILKNKIKFYRVLFIYSNILVLSTLSVTAIFQLLILYAAVFLNFNFKNLIVFFCLIALIFIFIFALPDSYLFSNLKFFSSLQSFEDGLLISASLADRYYSLFAPSQGLGSSISIFGNGIASDYYYFNDLVPYPANELIADSRSGYVGFSSFLEKLFAGGHTHNFHFNSVFIVHIKMLIKKLEDILFSYSWRFLLFRLFSNSLYMFMVCNIESQLINRKGIKIVKKKPKLLFISTRFPLPLHSGFK